MMSRRPPTRAAAPPPSPLRLWVGYGGGVVGAGPGPAPSMVGRAGAAGAVGQPLGARAGNPRGPVSVGGVLAVVPALPVRDASRCRELRRRASEAALRSANVAALRCISGRCPVVPRWGLGGAEARPATSAGSSVVRVVVAALAVPPWLSAMHQERLEEPHVDLKQLVRAFEEACAGANEPRRVTSEAPVRYLMRASDACLSALI